MMCPMLKARKLFLVLFVLLLIATMYVGASPFIAQTVEGSSSAVPPARTHSMTTPTPLKTPVLIRPDPRNPFMQQRAPGALSATELEELRSAATLVGVSTGYYRNGCQSRAHAAWLRLPPQLQSRVGKIWIFQPSHHSYFRKQESILFTQDPGVRWDYHVALVFQTESGEEKVLDMALGKQFISVDEWISQYKVPDNSLLVTTTGSYYSYFSAGGVMTGFFEYSGSSCANKWVPGDLGYEKVGKVLLEDTLGCPSMNVFVSSSKAGKAELEHPDFANRHPGTRCEMLRQLYLTESERVLELLPGWAKPNGSDKCTVAAN